MKDAHQQEQVGMTGLADRLGQCALKVSGKKALAVLVGVSEASLYRYVNGESEIGAETLLAVAVAA